MAVHTVFAYPETCQVVTAQTGKVTWVARGNFQGRELVQKGRSERSALNRWKEIAEWRYRSS